MAKASQGDREDGQPAEPIRRRLSALDRVIQAAMGDSRTVGLADDPARDAYPEVWRWMSQTEGHRDTLMQPAVLTVQLGPEGVLVTMTHRDLKTTCSIACKYLADLLPAMEAALASPNPPLRSWGKDPEVRLRKRRPK